jgi:hypothetical protein
MKYHKAYQDIHHGSPIKGKKEKIEEIRRKLSKFDELSKCTHSRSLTQMEPTKTYYSQTVSSPKTKRGF